MTIVKNIGKPNDIIVIRTKQPKDLNMISKVGERPEGDVILVSFENIEHFLLLC